MTTDRHCLDAETVAAWIDGGLDAPTAAAAEAHASNCERCQALLATVVRTIPADAAVSGSLGAEALAKAASRVDDQRARLWKWWLAPVAATAAAVTIWMVVPQTPLQSPAAPVARDEIQQKAPSVEAVPAEPPPATPPAPTAQARAAEKPAQKPAANELADADTRSQDTLARSRADQSARQEKSAAFNAEARRAAPAAGADAAIAERVTITPAPPPAPAAAPAPVAPATPAEPVATAGLSKSVAPATMIVSPDPSSRWRSLAPGTVERSEDGGRVWIPVRMNAAEHVLAGASPSRLTCWLVGRNGLVLLATDGTNFTRLPFPASIDLVSVTSPGPSVAIVTTADGRTFRTEDVGRTWRIY